MSGGEGVFLLKIRLSQVVDAIRSASNEFEYFYDTETGKTVFLADESITGIDNEKLAGLIENSGDRFRRFPTKYDIHEYHIMENFVYSLPAGAAKQELVTAICGRGAFRRFKQEIHYHRIEPQWYAFQAQAYREIAIQWCQEERLEYEDDT